LDHTRTVSERLSSVRSCSHPAAITPAATALACMCDSIIYSISEERELHTCITHPKPVSVCTCSTD
jgi:hypothetical protein